MKTVLKALAEVASLALLVAVAVAIALLADFVLAKPAYRFGFCALLGLALALMLAAGFEDFRHRRGGRTDG